MRWPYSTYMIASLLALQVVVFGQVILTDGQMTGWTEFIASRNLSNGNPTTSGGSISVVSGGNPGNCLAIQNVIANNSGMLHYVRSPILVWDPATQGAIDSIDMSIDVASLAACSGAGQGISFFVYQAGNYYGATSTYFTSSCQSTFHSFSSTNLMQSSFSLGPWYVAGGPSPDFSASGSPIFFGIVTSNSTAFGGGGYSTTIFYDNLTIGVHQPLWPGTHNDFQMRVSRNGAALADLSLLDLSTGDLLSVSLESPGAIYWYSPVFIGLDYSATGVPTNPAAGLWLNPGTVAVVIDGFASAGPLGSPNILGPFGPSYGFVIPGGLSGSYFVLQSAALSSTVGLALSNACRLHVL